MSRRFCPCHAGGHAEIARSRMVKDGSSTIDASALRLGVGRAERERRIARSRGAGKDHECVTRDLDVDVLQVVLARAAHSDKSGHGSTVTGPPPSAQARPRANHMAYKQGSKF